jgi:hypothetical protein
MELLICLGQALWQRLTSEQSRAHWLLLDSEFLAGVKGEIDEEALKEKRALLGSCFSAASDRRLERYGRASFAGRRLSTFTRFGTMCKLLVARSICPRRRCGAGWNCCQIGSLRGVDTSCFRPVFETLGVTVAVAKTGLLIDILLVDPP